MTINRVQQCVFPSDWIQWHVFHNLGLGSPHKLGVGVPHPQPFKPLGGAQWASNYRTSITFLSENQSSSWESNLSFCPPKMGLCKNSHIWAVAEGSHLFWIKGGGWELVPHLKKKWLVFSTFCKYFVIGVLFDAEKKVAKSPLACKLGKEVGKKSDLTPICKFLRHMF